MKKYEKYRNKYNDTINEENREIESIVYGIMIYESYNRPAFYRIFEYIKCATTGQATLGIMQVKSRVFISNKTSVKLGYKIIKEEYEKRTNEEYYETEKVRNTLIAYNGGTCYADEVMYIIMVINEEMKSNTQIQEHVIEVQSEEISENEMKWIKYLLYDTLNNFNTKEFKIEYFEYSENTLVNQFWDKLLEKYPNEEKQIVSFKIITDIDCYYINWETANYKFEEFISKLDTENIIIILPLLSQGVTIARYDSCKIVIHSNEENHRNMPHVHIIKNDGKSTRVNLQTLRVLDEDILSKEVYKNIFDYLDKNKDYLINLYNDIINHKEIKKITIDIINNGLENM